MLVLTRRIGETIMVGDDMTVTVLSVQGGHVRIGVKGTKHGEVQRQEVYERIQAEKSAASA